MSELVIYTAYDHPTDFPHCIVVRGWTIVNGQEIPHAKEFMTADDIEEVRRVMQNIGKVILARYTDDDPNIIENYI